MVSNDLTMKFDPKVIEHLGVRMYSTLPPVLSELIANAYDADATRVEVHLIDEGKKKIVVKDNGIGMSRNDIGTKFLVIGRNRRDGGRITTPRGRKPIGKKGLGKLSFFGIVKTITVDTVRGRKRNVFRMDWNKLMRSSGDYAVDQECTDEPVRKKNGTTITLTNIKRSSLFSPQSVANSIAKYFILDDGFKISVHHNKERPIKVTNALRYDALKKEFSWRFPDGFRNKINSTYKNKLKIRGEIITTKEPIPPNTMARGITLFSRKKLVQTPYQFSDSTSSHFFSYLSGWLEVDFIDDLPPEDDVISTNRQSLNWEHPETKKLHAYCKSCIRLVEKEWRKKRSENKQKKVKEIVGFDADKWAGTMPENVKRDFQDLLKNITTLPGLGEAEYELLFGSLQKVMPLYAAFHWRHLHQILQKSLRRYYERGQYIEAAEEGVKQYETAVRGKSLVQYRGAKLFNEVYSSGGPILEIQSPYDDPESKENIQMGQRSLSVGLIESFRNPTSHNIRLVNQQAFSQGDCLDILSLISFLLHRVDGSKKRRPKKKASGDKSKRKDK